MTAHATSHHETPVSRVYRLRREGRLKEALDAVRTLWQGNRRGKREAGAYGWVLYSLIQQERRTPSPANPATAWLEELRTVPIPADDELLRTRVARLLEIPNDLEAGLTEIFALKKQNYIQQALETGRRLLKRYPRQATLNETHAWCLCKRLWQLAKEDPIPKEDVRDLLAEYQRLEAISRPSKVHSSLLAVATLLQPAFPGYLSFVPWWDLVNLMPEDYQRDNGNGRTYAALAEKVAKALYHALKGDVAARRRDGAWATDFVLDIERRFPDHEWIPYYAGCLLIWSGRAPEARSRILPVLERKSRDFWPWHMMAETCGPDEKDLRLACLCRAISARVPGEAFILHVRENLARLLWQRGERPAAKSELEQVLACRRANGWPVRGKLAAFIQTPAYVEVEAPADNKALYAQWAPRASEAFGQPPLPPAPPEDPPLQFTGPAHRKPGQPFAFVNLANGESVFIPRPLVAAINLQHGQMVCGKAKRAWDPKKEVWSWRADHVEAA